ncbi:MAG TPA: hypothetical protein DDW98_02630, partial [Gammaproteobacteria bacterium]|nr:hypothetical protein [Gammaproteobacteria bacterium]
NWIDLDGAQELAYWLVSHGSDGLVVNGTTGESPTLSSAESIDLFRAVRQGYGHGAFEGRETQQPAAFVIDGNGQIRQAHYGRNITDLPDPNVLLSEARALGASQAA